jgi:hypothetical protein
VPARSARQHPPRVVSSGSWSRYLQGYFRNFASTLIFVPSPPNAVILGRREYALTLECKSRKSVNN